MSTVAGGKKTKKYVAAVKWSLPTIEKFLELFEDHPQLWDTQSEDYHLTDKRDSAYKSLLVGLQEKNITVTEEQLKTKIKSIRSTYRSELAKITLSKRSGNGTDQVYVPKLAWFAKADKFLREVTSYRESKSNLQNNEDPAEGVELLNDNNVDGLSTPSTSFTSRKSSNSSSSGAPTIKKPKISPNIAALDKVVSTLQKISQRSADDMREADEFEIYGKYIACELRKLPAASAALLQDECNKLLSQYKLQSLGLEVTYEMQ